jgi:hypothetical protein
MFGRAIQRWANKSHEKELQEFLSHLNAADDYEVGLTVALASEMRHRVSDMLGYHLLFPTLVFTQDPMATINIVKIVKQLQSEKNFVAAAALMVWAHTLRASGPAASGELRTLARQMWYELSRGFPYVEAAACSVVTTLGFVPRLASATEFPDGLSPRPGKEF